MYSTSMVVGAVLVVSSILLGAQTPGQSAPPPRPPAPSPTGTNSNTADSDRAFMIEAAMAGMAEVEHGRLASAKAAHAKVKAFGEQMLADHMKAGDELKSLAALKQVTLPTSLDPKHQATHEKFARLSGAEFDRAYMQDMVADHQKAVADFTAEANAGKDTEVKAWATKTLPTLQAHLKMAQDLQTEVGGSPSEPRR